MRQIDEQHVVSMNPTTLSALAGLLNEGSLNYNVFLQCHAVRVTAGASSEALIRTALGPGAVIGACRSVSPEDALTEIRESLAYAGDSGAGPSPQAMQSRRFAELLDRLLAEVGAISKRPATTEQFWLSAGHPAYPVFWDFAFLFKAADEAFILVGSSSD